MDIPERIFREYDIRGVVGDDLTENLVYNLGRGIGTFLTERGVSICALGYDMRPSSTPFADALTKGIISTGVDVIDIGMVPTPTLYFTTRYQSIKGGVMITGSHNPPQFNGFKVVCGRGTIYGDDIKKIGEIMSKGEFVIGEGALKKMEVIGEYKNHLISLIEKKGGLNIVVDCGNGMASECIVELLEKMGNKIMPLFCELDGTFPNHFPDPTILENTKAMRKCVVDVGADCGMAFDGDADRLGASDEKGDMIFGDRLLALYSRHVLKRNPGAKIIFEVKCSRALSEDISKHGGKPIMWKTGHSLIEAKLDEEGALLAGEMSGHLYFADNYYGYDDAIYASMRLAELISDSNKTLSEMLSTLPQYVSSPEIRIACPDDIKFKVVNELLKKFREKYNVNDIDGMRVELEDGWGLVRASNTQPVLVLRFEGKDEMALEQIQNEIEEELEDVLHIFGLK
ncbi:MAG: phosphomannomutase/phosphoglucomutase [bacterium]